MKRLTTSSYKIYANISSTIAFWPSIISAGFLVLAVVMLYFETTSLSTFLERRLPFMLAKEEENARLILNIVAAGTISLTVFSFSMVMIVLSQASSNLTPRVIPRLAAVKAHQIVLGFYIGTILYSLILLLNFQKEGAGKEATPAIAILFALICGLFSIILFVFFIHSISHTIQVDNILNHIFQKSYQALKVEREESNKFKGESTGHEQEGNQQLNSTRNGYIKLIELEKLLEHATKHDLQLTILADAGTFVVEGYPILSIQCKAAPDKALFEELENCFLLSLKEVVMEDFEQGVKQISEIAVKALSPGINDPGTATKAIDFLTLLFMRRMKNQPNAGLFDAANNLRVIEKIITVNELLFRYITPIRTYGKEDVQIILRLIKSLESLIMADGETKRHQQELAQHVTAIMYDADEHINNSIDRDSINNSVRNLNKILPPELCVAPLTT